MNWVALGLLLGVVALGGALCLFARRLYRRAEAQNAELDRIIERHRKAANEV